MSKLSEYWKRLSPEWRFAISAFVVTRLAMTLWSLGVYSIFPIALQNLDLFGEPLVTAFDLKTGGRYVYSRQVDDNVLSFRVLDSEYMTDDQSGSVWSLHDGRAIQGEYAGRSLGVSSHTAEEIFTYLGVPPANNIFLSIWQRFDVNWYLVIARNGYGSVSGDVHFPPLYPVFIRWVSSVLRDDMLSGMIVSQLALCYLLKLLYELFTKWGNETLASRSLFFFLIFPTSFFMFSAYTEAIFMVAAVLCLRYIQNGKWHWAGFWILCAILIRLQGVALLIPLVWGILRTRFKDIRWIDIFYAVLYPAVAAGVYLLLRASSGDSSFIPLNEPNLHARIVPPWENLIYSVQFIVGGSSVNYIDVFNLVAFVAFGALLVANWMKFPIEYTLFSAVSMVIFSMRWVDTQPLNSMIRYLLTVFPIFFLFGRYAENKWMNRFMFLLFLSLNLFLSAQFFLWGWVA